MQLVNGHISGIVCSAHAFTPTFLILLSWRLRRLHSRFMKHTASGQNKARTNGQSFTNIQFKCAVWHVCFIQSGVYILCSKIYTQIYKMKICIMISSVRNIFLLCIWCVLHTQCYNTFPVSCTDNIRISCLCMFWIYVCIHPSICPCYCACMDLSRSIYCNFVGLDYIFPICRVTCFGDSSSCMKWTGTRSTHKAAWKTIRRQIWTVHVLLSIMNRLYLDIVSADNANKHTFSAVAQWTLVVL